MQLQITKNGAVSRKACEALFRAEKDALQHSYPEGGRGYAAAVLTKNGNIYTGVSYKSDTETLTMHAEATALAHAAIHGEKDIIAITGPNCHICKQLIYENGLRSGINIMIVFKERGSTKQIPISTFMLHPWPDKPREKRHRRR